MKSFSAAAVLIGSVAAATDYLNGYVPQEPTCYLPLDVLFVQDTTQSFTEDLVNVVKQIPQMLSLIAQYHPNSRFGVAEFKDKPFEPFGFPGYDYCYRLAADLTSTPADFFYAYSDLYASGGDDLPESQYQACINAIQDPNSKWRNIGTGPDDVGARIIIMSTDACPHYEGDYSSNLQPASWGPYPGHITSNMTFDCDNTRYPSYQQFADAFAGSEGTYLAILTPDTDTDVVADWKWVNEDLLGQDPAFYQFISDDSSDFILGVLKALESVTATVCPPTTTTSTDSPSTTSTTITNHGDPSTSTETTDTTTEGVVSTTAGECTGCTGSTDCNPNEVVAKASGHPSVIDIGILYNNGTVSNITSYDN